MKKIAAAVLTVILVLSLAACAGATKTAQEQTSTPMEQTTITQEQTAITPEQTSTPDADWNLPETIEMTDEVTAIFGRAMEGLTGVHYEPQGYLGEKDGVYCVLCRATVVAPDAKPYYALVYVSEAGLQNIWDIWMGAHAEKKDE